MTEAVSGTVAKPFNTLLQRYREGEPVGADAYLAPLDFQHLVKRGFISFPFSKKRRASR
ncbi:hypothetical protein [Rhizobium rhizoryzae]|uniref:hypothetical protein n=1 Tax=Rhizobium rhizoryzae TaxID=451876 RepID=UPI0028985931|nr:hypothetical protein [Rhizobium rhizoryzae]